MDSYTYRSKNLGGEGGALQISSDRDIEGFFGFEIFDSVIFLGRKIWQVFLENMKAQKFGMGFFEG